MTQQRIKLKKVLLLIPIFGAVLFIILYLIATLLYPGGSQVDKNSQGFSWMNNYWCNLLERRAINGQYNAARPIAVTGLFVLCGSLSFFWLIFSHYFDVSNKIKFAIKVCGPLSMIISLLMLTDIGHNIVTNLASLFGVVAVVATLIALYKTKWLVLFLFGLFNILLVGLNNYVYHIEGLIVYLPIIQKISFLSFLVWFCWIDINLYRMKKQSSILIE